MSVDGNMQNGGDEVGNNENNHNLHLLDKVFIYLINKNGRLRRRRKMLIL